MVKAKAELTGPKQVGKIDLEPKKKAKPVVKKEEVKQVPEEVAKPELEASATPASEMVEEKEVKKAKEEQPKTAESEEAVSEGPEAIETQYKKLSGPKIMGDKIDLTKFNKPKKKAEPAKKTDDHDRKKRRKTNN